MNTNLLSVVLIIAGAGMYFGYISPTYSGISSSDELGTKSITELLEKRSEYQGALDKTKEIEEARTGLLAVYNKISEDDRHKMNKMLPATVDSVRLIIDLNSVAAKSKMSPLSAISVSVVNVPTTKTGTVAQSPAAKPAVTTQSSVASAVAATKKYLPAKITFTVSGSYDSLINFLKNLESSLRIVDVTSLSLKPPTDSKSDEYNYTITLQAYRLR